MIKFGISKNYVPNWSVVQAIREIYQNFIDYGEFEVAINDICDKHSSVRISNSFKPKNWEFLKIGFSKKKDGSIGKHGEGLKLAGLVFGRNNKMFRISSSVGRAEVAFYEDDKLGECYGLQTCDFKIDRFEVYFEANTEDLNIFQNGYIKPEDIVESSHYGDIVRKDPGNIYVGGLFVCNLKGLKYALNFKPDKVDLGRDREMLSTWDIEYYTNRIINSCSDKLEFDPPDINNREFNVGSLPKELTRKFKPIMSDEGHIQMKAGKTVVTDECKIKEISKNPEVARKVEKLRYNAIYKQKKAPSTILTELMEELDLSVGERIRFKSIIKLSHNWKRK